jgi:hypothetical protein
MIFLLPAALAVALMTGAAAKADFQAAGAGRFVSCGSWTSARRDRAAVVYEQWILGFVSGVAWDLSAGRNPMNGLKNGAVWAWIDNYCQGHPIDMLGTAGSAFANAHPR